MTALAVTITPPGKYYLSHLTWDSTEQGGTILVRTNPATAPLWLVRVTNNSVNISNLEYGVTYSLSVSNSGGISTNFTWPWPREDYFTTQNYSQTTIGGTKVVLPATLVVTTNVITRAMWGFVGVQAWTSNNISGFIYPQ